MNAGLAAAAADKQGKSDLKADNEAPSQMELLRVGENRSISFGVVAEVRRARAKTLTEKRLREEIVVDKRKSPLEFIA